MKITMIISIIILAVFLGNSNATFTEAEVIYRWGDHLEQFQRGLGFLAEMRELAHIYTASWMSVACIQNQVNAIKHLKRDTDCNKKDASQQAAASSAFFTMWKLNVQGRKDIFVLTKDFFNATEQASIIATSTAFYDTQKQWIKDNLGHSDANIAEGERIGQDVANWIWNIRGNDGFNKTTYSFVAKCASPPCPIGVWWPSSPNSLPPAPQWADITLLCDDPDLFDGDNDIEKNIHVPPPPLPLSLNANASADEIFFFGRLGSTVRTADQTEVGRFWHEGSGFAYFVPVMRAIDNGYGGLYLIQVLRALMHAAAATFDSNIVQYHYKFKYQSWRPWQRFNYDLWGTPENPTPSPPGKSEFAIQNISGVWLPFTMTSYPGSPNGASVASPNHPDYPAGHPTGTGAWTRMFELLFPDIQGTNFPGDGFGYLNKSSRVELGHKFNMKYTNIAEVTHQIIGARMYVGYHFTYASVMGINTGRHVAKSCFEKLSRFTGDNPNYGTWTGTIPDMLQYH